MSCFWSRKDHEYRNRRRLTSSFVHCPPVTVWQYRSIPLQDPGNAIVPLKLMRG